MGVVWLKTTHGKSTSGFYSFPNTAGQFVDMYGSVLDMPSASKKLVGDELIDAIGKSLPKGIYVRVWNETKDEWQMYLHLNNLDQVSHWNMVDDAIKLIADAAGLTSPHNCSKKESAKKKAQATAKKERVELEFNRGIITTLEQMKRETVRALEPT